MCRSADVIQPLEGRRVIARSRKRAPQKELIEVTGTGIRIPPFKVDMEAFQICGAQHLASQNVRAKVRNQSFQPRNDPVSVQLTHIRGPSAVEGSGNLSQRVAGDSTR